MNLQMLQFKLQQVLKNNSLKRAKLATYWKIVPSRLAHYKTSNLLFSQPIPNTWKKYKCDLLLDVSRSMLIRDRIWPAVEVVQKLIKLFYWIIDFRITCFAVGSYTMNARDILSIEPERFKKEWEIYFDKVFNRNVEYSYDWEDKIFQIRFEWKKDRATKNWTIITPALAQAWFNLLNEEWEKFIVLITDWYEEIYDESLRWETFVCWLPYSKFNTSTHKAVAKSFIEKWINILPIGIQTNSLNDFYDNVIEITNAENVYEPVLKFIEEHFA